MKLGIGVPHLVQSFFARMRDYATFRNSSLLKVEDVDEVYRTTFLGPAGQNDIVHYDTRLQDALEEDDYTIAMEVLAEAATQDVFTQAARRCLENQYSRIGVDVRRSLTDVSDVLDVLVHGWLPRSRGLGLPVFATAFEGLVGRPIQGPSCSARPARRG